MKLGHINILEKSIKKKRVGRLKKKVLLYLYSLYVGYTRQGSDFKQFLSKNGNKNFRVDTKN